MIAIWLGLTTGNVLYHGLYQHDWKMCVTWTVAQTIAMVLVAMLRSDPS